MRVDPKELEKEVLVNRVLYYCYDCPVISDYEYDMLERKAREMCPTESPVHGIGSSLKSSYPKAILEEAARRYDAC